MSNSMQIKQMMQPLQVRSAPRVPACFDSAPRARAPLPRSVALTSAARAQDAFCIETQGSSPLCNGGYTYTPSRPGELSALGVHKQRFAALAVRALLVEFQSHTALCRRRCGRLSSGTGVLPGRGWTPLGHVQQ